MKSFKVGDRVAYNVRFLQSIYESPAGDMAAARGVVEDVKKIGPLVLVRVKWDSDMPQRVAATNLAHVGR